MDDATDAQSPGGAALRVGDGDDVDVARDAFVHRQARGIERVVDCRDDRAAGAVHGVDRPDFGVVVDDVEIADGFVGSHDVTEFRHRQTNTSAIYLASGR